MSGDADLEPRSYGRQVDQAITLTIGPVPSSVTLAWCENRRAILDAVRDSNGLMPVRVRQDMLDLCDSLLVIWETIARKQDPFTWSMPVEPDMLEYVATQWLELGTIGGDDLDALGLSWSPESTASMAVAVQQGMAEALMELGERAQALTNRIRLR